LAKEINFTSLMPQGHAAAPKNKLRGIKQRKSLCNKKARQVPGFSIFVTLYCKLDVHAQRRPFVKAAII
jgi:hypothetical protein